MSEDAAARILIEGLHELGYSDASAIAKRLMRYGDLLLAANTLTNLSGAHTMADLVTHHFLDSIAPLSGMKLRSPVADAGSGAGLPGIPYALAHEEARVVLIEPRRLRAAFLDEAVAALKIEDRVTVLKSTCEAAGRSNVSREQAGSVLMRAIAKPEKALELGAPLLTLGGDLFLYRGREAEPSAGDLAAADAFGLALRRHRPIAVPHLEAKRHIWIFRKVRKTGEGYPRRRRGSLQRSAKEA